MNPHIIFPAAGLLLFLLGWPLALRRVKPNPLYGLRVRATMMDERVWYDANAVAGKDSMVFGALFTATALLLPWVGVTESAYKATCITAMGAGLLVLTIRGWRTANRMQRERRGVE